MKNLDLISKRILVISLSISAVLLSASLLFFSVKPANAQSPQPSFSSRMDDGRRYDAVSSNVSTGGGGSCYGNFLIWNTQTGAYKVVSYNPTSDPNLYTNKDLSEKFW